MIFIVKDEHNEQRDRVRRIVSFIAVCTNVSMAQMIAKHVMNIHMNRPNEMTGENGEVVGEIDIDKMKRYIAYCKAWVPHWSPAYPRDSSFCSAGNALLGCLRMHRRC